MKLYIVGFGAGTREGMTIAAQLPFISGSAYIDKKNISFMKKHEIARKLSIVLTERIEAEKMSCEDIVATGRYPYTGRLGILSAADTRIVDEAMELAGILHLKDCDIRKISDGQKQCVIRAVKYQYNNGIKARKGIEY